MTVQSGWISEGNPGSGNRKCTHPEKHGSAFYRGPVRLINVQWALNHLTWHLVQTVGASFLPVAFCTSLWQPQQF